MGNLVDWLIDKKEGCPALFRPQRYRNGAKNQMLFFFSKAAKKHRKYPENICPVILH